MNQSNDRSKDRRSREKACTCAAYPFPHRPGSGPCQARQPNLWCGECRLPCSGYRPAPYNMFISRCCHADIYTSATFDNLIETEAERKDFRP